MMCSIIRERVRGRRRRSRINTSSIMMRLLPLVGAVLILMAKTMAQEVESFSAPDGKVDTDGDLIATNQWQRVPDGAAVPGVRFIT